MVDLPRCSYTVGEARCPLVSALDSLGALLLRELGGMVTVMSHLVSSQPAGLWLPLAWSCGVQGLHSRAEPWGAFKKHSTGIAQKYKHVPLFSAPEI